MTVDEVLTIKPNLIKLGGENIPSMASSDSKPYVEMLEYTRTEGVAASYRYYFSDDRLIGISGGSKRMSDSGAVMPDFIFAEKVREVLRNDFTKVNNIEIMRKRESNFEIVTPESWKDEQSLLSVCPEKANFEILNFRKATTCFMKACYGLS